MQISQKETKLALSKLLIVFAEFNINNGIEDDKNKYVMMHKYGHNFCYKTWLHCAIL